MSLLEVEARRDERAPRSHVTPSDVATVLAVLVGTALWWGSVRALDLHGMSDLGLASVLGVGGWLGIAIVAGSFLSALRAGRPGALGVALGGTVLVLHGLAAAAEPAMRFSVAWRHVGIVDYFAVHGATDPYLDAYQNWPGFFAFGAVLRDVAGISDPASVLAWTPVVYQLLYLLPIIAIGRRLLGDPRAAWLGAWIFTVSCWVGQDYFSPQGLYLFLYLVVLAVLVEWFTPTGPGGSGEGTAELRLRPMWLLWHDPAPGGRGSTPRQRILLLAAILVLVVAAVSGHQLSPFALVLGTAALALAGWSRLPTLPVVVLLMALLWIAFPAYAYYAGHAGEIRGHFGALSTILEQNIDNRVTGSPGHQVVVRWRMIETVGIGLLGLVGLLRLLHARRGAAARVLAALALAPVPLLAVASYGGEALLRVTLFALPFLALLAAAALTRPGRPALRPLLAVALVGGLLVAAFPLVRYGNERMDWFSPQEVAGVRQVYAQAPVGSVIASVTGGLPWRFAHYADYEYRQLVDRAVPATITGPGSGVSVDLDSADPGFIAEEVVARIRPGPGGRAFLVVSRSQAAELDLLGPFRPGASDRLEAALRSSTAFRIVIRQPDIAVYEYVEESP